MKAPRKRYGRAKGGHVLGAGVRVRTHITKPERYARGAAAKLNRLVGTVERQKADGEWLVHFDTPAQPWHTHQLPVTGFWFPSDELTVVT